jgi:hypothetical protein
LKKISHATKIRFVCQARDNKNMNDDVKNGESLYLSGLRGMQNRHRVIHGATKVHSFKLLIRNRRPKTIVWLFVKGIDAVLGADIEMHISEL